jgi:hypothetical protein
MIEAAPIAMPDRKPIILNILRIKPLITPMATMNMSGSTKPPVFGISLKNSEGEVRTLIAVSRISVRLTIFFVSINSSY